jgi:hypothetical protein
MKIKHAFVLVVCFLLFGGNVFSQDIIFFKNGSKDTVKIEEITARTVSYKKFYRQNSPLYKVLKKDVLLIEYSDGTIITIDESESLGKKKPLRDVPVDWSPNIISANIFGAFIGNLHLGYERLNYKGTMGIRFNLLATMLPKITDVSMVAGGFDFNFYPAGQKRVSYYLGPGFRLGAVNYLNDNLEAQSTNFAAIVFNNGVSFNPSRYFYFGLQLGGGVGMDRDSHLLPYGYFMFNIGGKL